MPFHGHVNVQSLRTYGSYGTLSGFDGEFQADGPGDRDQRGQTRVSSRRQRSIETLPLNASRLCDFGNALCFGEMPQSDKQNARLVLILQCSFQVLGSELRIGPYEGTRSRFLVAWLLGMTAYRKRRGEEGRAGQAAPLRRRQAAKKGVRRTPSAR